MPDIELINNIFSQTTQDKEKHSTGWGIELLGIIRVMCETIDNRTTDRKFSSLIRHVADCPNCKTKKGPAGKAG